jgi:transcriptional regulator with XRE-family HTH domain
MSAFLTAAEFRRAASVSGRTMVDVCREARVAFSTFTRWERDKTSPRLRTYGRLLDVVEPAIRAGTVVESRAPTERERVDRVRRERGYHPAWTDIVMAIRASRVERAAVPPAGGD